MQYASHSLNLESYHRLLTLFACIGGAAMLHNDTCVIT